MLAVFLLPKSVDLRLLLVYLCYYFITTVVVFGVPSPYSYQRSHRCRTLPLFEACQIHYQLDETSYFIDFVLVVAVNSSPPSWRYSSNWSLCRAGSHHFLAIFVGNCRFVELFVALILSFCRRLFDAKRHSFAIYLAVLVISSRRLEDNRQSVTIDSFVFVVSLPMSRWWSSFHPHPLGRTLHSVTVLSVINVHPSPSTKVCPSFHHLRFGANLLIIATILVVIVSLSPSSWW